MLIAIKIITETQAETILKIATIVRVKVLRIKCLCPMGAKAIANRLSRFGVLDDLKMLVITNDLSI